MADETPTKNMDVAAWKAQQGERKRTREEVARNERAASQDSTTAPHRADGKQADTFMRAVNMSAEEYDESMRILDEQEAEGRTNNVRSSTAASAENASATAAVAPVGDAGASTCDAGDEEGEVGDLFSDSPPRMPRGGARKSLPLITNSTQESEDASIDAQRIANIDHFVPWLPNWAAVERLHQKGYGNKTVRLFDTLPLHVPPSMRENYKQCDAQHRHFIELFFRHQFFVAKKFRAAELQELDALAQAWDQFAVNLNRVGYTEWCNQLWKRTDEFERRTVLGAKIRLHMASRRAGMPCCIPSNTDCPMCYEGADYTPSYVIETGQGQYSERITPEVVDALNNLNTAIARARERKQAERLASGANAAATTSSSRTGQQGPVRRQGVDRAAPTYQPTRGTHASAPSTGGRVGAWGQGHGGSGWSPPPTAYCQPRPLEAAAVEGRSRRSDFPAPPPALAAPVHPDLAEDIAVLRAELDALRSAHQKTQRLVFQQREQIEALELAAEVRRGPQPKRARTDGTGANAQRKR